MIVEFEGRSGNLEQMQMDLDEPCPICCGMLFLIDETDPESGFRCSSCSITFEVVDDEYA